MCTCKCLSRSEDGVGCPGAGVKGSCELCNMELGNGLKSSKEQQALGTTEPSLQPLYNYFYIQKCEGTGLSVKTDCFPCK